MLYLGMSFCQFACKRDANPSVATRVCVEIGGNLLISSHLVYFFVSPWFCSSRGAGQNLFNPRQKTKRTGFHDTDDLLKRLTRGNSHFNIVIPNNLS